MKIFRYSFHIDDEIRAETIEDAWQVVKARDEDNWYGPTIANLELIGEEEEEVKTE